MLGYRYTLQCPACRRWFYHPTRCVALLASATSTAPCPTWRLWNPSVRWPDYVGARAVRFLSQHQTCRIGIRDENGDEHPTEEDPR